MVAIFGNKGKSALTPNLQPIELPVISKIPFLGEVFSGHTILLYAFLLIAVLCWVIMYKTPEGIRLRSAGTNPEVIEALGLSVKAIQYRAVFTSGILAGIGGAYLSIAQLNFYSSDMVSGRGFIAIAVFVFAGGIRFAVFGPRSFSGLQRQFRCVYRHWECRRRSFRCCRISARFWCWQIFGPLWKKHHIM